MRFKAAVLAAVMVASACMLAVPASAAAPSGQLSEMNVQLWGNYSALGLAITAFPGSTWPMLNNFEIIVHSPGNSTVSVSQGGTIVSQDSGWSWYHTVYVNTSYSGTILISINVTSLQLGRSSVFLYSLDFMTPVSYINYEKAKITPVQQVPLIYIAEAFAGGGVAVYGIGKMIRKIWIKPSVSHKHDKGGLYRSG